MVKAQAEQAGTWLSKRNPAHEMPLPLCHRWNALEDDVFTHFQSCISAMRAPLQLQNFSPSCPPALSPHLRPSGHPTRRLGTTQPHSVAPECNC